MLSGGVHPSVVGRAVNTTGPAESLNLIAGLIRQN